jgi:hypothetical protein
MFNHCANSNPNLITSFKLVMKCDTKVASANKTPNIKIRRKWSCKIWPNSQCYYHIPLTICQITMSILIPILWNIIWTTFIHYIPFKTSSTHPLLDIKKPPNCNRSYPFLVWAHFHGYHKDRFDFTIPHTIHYDWTLKTQLIRFVK